MIRADGLGFRVSGLGGVGFRGFGFRILDQGFKAWGLGFRVPRIRRGVRYLVVGRRGLQGKYYQLLLQPLIAIPCAVLLDLVAEFISPKKMYTFSFVVGNIIPKSVSCIHSATKGKYCGHISCFPLRPP